MNRILSLFALLACSSAAATTVVPYPWYELLERADLIGVVQCVDASLPGPQTYRVLESWKGPGVGERVNIARTGYPDEKPPGCTQDVRYFVTAVKGHWR